MTVERERNHPSHTHWLPCSHDRLLQAVTRMRINEMLVMLRWPLHGSMPLPSASAISNRNMSHGEGNFSLDSLMPSRAHMISAGRSNQKCVPLRSFEYLRVHSNGLVLVSNDPGKSRTAGGSSQVQLKSTDLLIHDAGIVKDIQADEHRLPEYNQGEALFDHIPSTHRYTLRYKAHVLNLGCYPLRSQAPRR
jgi:hypothetical protein